MWINAIKRADLTETKIKYGRVCSKHFLTGKPSSLNDENNPDWVPSKGMGYTTIAISMQSKGLERYKRKKRAERILESTSIEPPEDLNQAIDVEEPGEVTIEDLQFALQKANTEIYSLTAEMSKLKLDEDYLKKDDKIVLYYTGFPEYIYVHNIVTCLLSTQTPLLVDSLIESPGNLVLADRGFSIDDSVKIYFAQVKYPYFLKGKKQLDAMDIETTQKLASVRMHVERDRFVKKKI